MIVLDGELGSLGTATVIRSCQDRNTTLLKPHHIVDAASFFADLATGRTELNCASYLTHHTSPADSLTWLTRSRGRLNIIAASGQSGDFRISETL